MNYEKIQNGNVLKNLDPSAILESENFEAIKYRACDYIDGLDWDYATVFARALEEKLGQASPANKQDQFIWRVLKFWVFKLRLFAFNNLSVSEQADLLKKNLVSMLTFGLDVKGYVEDSFGVFGSVKPIEDGVGNLLFALHNSNERLGSNTETFTKNSFQPTVANWLKEYQTILKMERAGVGSEAGAFHILKFLDTNANAKLLIAREKDVIKNLLDLYNWLLNPISYEKVRNTEARVPYIQSQKFELPREVLGAGRDVQALRVPPVVPRPGDGKDVGVSEVGTVIRRAALSDDLGGGRRSDNAGVGTLTPSFAKASEGKPALSPREREGIAGNNITPSNFAKASSDKQPPLIKRGGDNEKTASGEAIGSLTLGNKKAAPFGAAAGMSESSTGKNSISDIGNFNQKPAEAGLVDSNVVFESELPSKSRITQEKDTVNSNISSGGDEGIRTPRAMNGNSDSALRRPHSNELYHTPAQNTPNRGYPVESSLGESASQTFNRVNFQDILKDREQGQSGLTGLKMGNGGNQILNKDITSPLNQSSNSGSGQANPFLERRGMGTQNNPSSFILNPLLEKKPAVPQSGQSKQAEIDRKLEELQKRIKN